MERLRLTGGPYYDYGQPPVSGRRCTRAHRPLPMLSDAIRKRLQPKESSLSERNAMLPAHYDSTRAPLWPLTPSQAVGTAWKLAHACHSMRPVPLLSPPASYEPQMQGTENHGRRTPKRKVSWAGRLPPGMYSRD